MTRIEIAELHEQTATALRAKEGNGFIELESAQAWEVGCDLWADGEFCNGDNEELFYRIKKHPEYRPYTARELGSRIGEAFNDVDGKTHFLRMVDDDGCGYWSQRSSCCFAPRTLLNRCTWLNGSKMGVEVESE